MRVLVTGGAGFIGRWVVKQLLQDGHQVWVLDNFSNGSRHNVEEFDGQNRFMDIIQADIKDRQALQQLFQNKFDLCFHLAASINVQDSIDDPQTTFENDTVGTFYVLEECRKHKVKLVFMSTCMVYDRSPQHGIRESDPLKPASPYAGSKIAAENMVLSYTHTYGLPATVIRPFNTYGPYQKSGGEGGVVSIFLRRKLEGKPLLIYGDGKQTRDLLYVEDCARFAVQAGYSDRADGEILHAGLGKDISILELAQLIAGEDVPIEHVPHIHPQSEIMKLLCRNDKAKELLAWEPVVPLNEGIQMTEAWMRAALEESP